MYGMFANRYLPSMSTEAAYRGNACLSDDIGCANLDSSFHIHNMSFARKLEGMV